MRFLRLVCATACLSLAACGGGGGGGDVVVLGERVPHTAYYALGVIDFDGDGFNDLVATSKFLDPDRAEPHPATVEVFRQLPSRPGTFDVLIKFSLGATFSPYEMVLADLQMDSLPDVLVSGYESGMFVALQDPANPSSLLPPKQFDTLADPLSGWIRFTTGDIDLDGRPDLVLVNDKQVAYQLQDSSNPGQFLGPQLVGEGAGIVATADLNADGLLDIVTLDATGPADTVLYHRQNPNVVGQFITPLRLPCRFLN